MECRQDGSILANPETLDDDHLPPDIQLRETRVKEIIMFLSPLTEGRKPMSCWLFGKPGVGKTVTALWAFRKLEKESCIQGAHRDSIALFGDNYRNIPKPRSNNFEIPNYFPIWLFFNLPQTYKD